VLKEQQVPEFRPIPGEPLLQAQALYKSFTLHAQGGIQIPVLEDLSFSINAGECVSLSGPSGTGKSTLIRCLYGNYRVDSGQLWINHQGNWVDLAQLEPHQLLQVRQHTIGYVSQFLRVIPRVAAIEVAAEPLLELKVEPKVAYGRVEALFDRLNLPERLWQLSPTTFSGGEKQRVNIARTLVMDYPILLMDEPTSALDAGNRQTVVELLAERKAQGCAIIGIFHDKEVQSYLCDRTLAFDQ
jgi:alpha-D-ribose 1-methylphosphonate 5-triphosphate synthase subunit PhnL